MSKRVYANGREISGKANDNKSVAAMPDTCLSPPSPPAGPVPIPYPNTATAADTSSGSKSVKIGGQEVGLKNQSDYSTSKGDEAATRSFGMGVVTHTIQGTMKHEAWSMDVKIEGENVLRHMDLTSHNHNNPSNLAATMNAAGMSVPIMDTSCEELKRRNDDIKRSDMAPDAPKEGWTTATAVVEGSPGAFLKAATPEDIILPGRRNGFTKTKRGTPKGSAPTIACTGKPYPSGNKSAGHCEPKLFEKMLSAAKPGDLPVVVRMNIDWRQSGKPPAQGPCGNCRNFLCDAVGCGLIIKLCQVDSEGKMQENDACPKT